MDHLIRRPLSYGAKFYDVAFWPVFFRMLTDDASQFGGGAVELAFRLSLWMFDKFIGGNLGAVRPRF
jgi:hypothetical protein